jgi:hypothetical protein
MGRTNGANAGNVKYSHDVGCSVCHALTVPLSFNSIMVVGGSLVAWTAIHQSLDDGCSCTFTGDVTPSVEGGAEVGSLGADVGSLGADVGLLGAEVGPLGAEVGLLGAEVGADVGSLGAEVGLLGADVGLVVSPPGGELDV